MKILLVEDDPQLGDSLKAALEFEGYAVDWVLRGDEVVATLGYSHFDCVVMDVGLPGIDGFQALSRLRRKKYDLPVLMLTARDTLTDRVEGLDRGADDYLTKPFEIDELFARIRSLLRRSQGQMSEILEAGQLQFNANERTVTFAGDDVDLTARELVVLETLLRNKGRFVTKARLEESMYAWGEEASSNTAEVYISRLRKRFGSGLIQTSRGIGYRIAE